MKSIFLGLALFISTHAFAGVTELVSFANTFNKDIGVLYINTDEKFDIENFEYIQKNKRGKVVENFKFTVADVIKGRISKDPIIGKHVTTSSENITDYQGGHITVKFPKNFLRGKYATSTFELVRLGDEWKARNDQKQFIADGLLKIKRVLGVPVGVNEILFFQKN